MLLVSELATLRVGPFISAPRQQHGSATSSICPPLGARHFDAASAVQAESSRRSVGIEAGKLQSNHDGAYHARAA